MRHTFLPFSRPSITEDEIRAVSEVLRSGWITTGPKVGTFEQEFCRAVGCAGAVALASATAGMHLLLRALGIGPGDEVITPSLTWVSTVNLIVLSGAAPVLADVDRDTLMVTPSTVEPCISAKTRLILPVHFAGAAVDLFPLRELASGKGIALAEDAAHALGTHYKGEPIGRKGTSIFSFHPIKNITTGEGGMFCSDDPDLLRRIQRLRFHGLGQDAYDRQMQGRSPQAEVLEPGYKYNMTDMAAALGLKQLERLDLLNTRRAELAKRYGERLCGVEEILPLSVPAHTTRHSWHLFVIRLDTDRAGLSRDEFMDHLKKRNIGTGLHFQAAHLQKYYREVMGFCRGLLPNTEWNSDRICSLPLFPDMNHEDVDEVVETIKGLLRRSPERLISQESKATKEVGPGPEAESPQSPQLSVVIPVFNEEANLPELIRRCLATCEALGLSFEIIFVDDGSSDQSTEMITGAATDHPGRVVAVVLNRNYGQHSAVMAGFEHSKGEIVVTLDADLQNPPEEIPKLVEKAQAGFDVVGSVRVPRQDSFFRRVASSLVNRVVQKSTGVTMKDYGCMLRAYRRPIVDAMLQCHERSTFIPVLANSFARRTTEIEVRHAPRSAGDSKYSLLKLVSLQFDLLTGMTTFPLRILSMLGGLISAVGIGFGLFLFLMRWIYGPEWAVGGIFTLFAILFIFVGAQFVGMGLLGEYLGRIYYDVRARPRYFVERVVGRGENT